MKYALLAYAETDRKHRTSEEKRTLHDPSHYVRETTSTRLIAHYRCRPSRHATTLRLDEDELVWAEVSTSERGTDLRALFIVESDDYETVVDRARQLPILQQGGTVDIWPLTEPSSSSATRPRRPR